jgi:hypothetical protein
MLVCIIIVAIHACDTVYARSDMYMNLDLGLCDLWAAKIKKWLWKECEGVYNGNGPNCGRRQRRQPTMGMGTGWTTSHQH